MHHNISSSPAQPGCHELAVLTAAALQRTARRAAMPAPRGSVAALLLLLAVVLCAAQGAITRHEATSDTGATPSLSQRQLAGLSPRVVRAAEDESSGEQQQVVGDLNKQTLAAEDDDNDVADKGLAPAGDVAGAETEAGAGAGTDAAAPPEVLVPADPSGGGRARGHYHYHDKAGCFGYGYGRRRPNIIVINNPNNDNNGDSGDPDSEQLRQAPRSRRGRSRGRRAAPASSATAPGDAPHFNLWLYPAAVKRSRAARASLDHRLGVSTEVLLPYRPYALQRKTVNDLDFNDLDHRKLESRLEDDGRERVKREAEDPEGADDNEVEVVPEPSLLDYSIKDLVKRCVNAIVGGSSGKSSNGAVSIARDGVAVGRAAVEGGIQVARMIVQAFRELGASPSLVGDMEPSQQGLPDLDADALSGLEARELTRDRRDAIQNVRKNLKNKAEIIMSRSNDIAEKVNDKMDSFVRRQPRVREGKGDDHGRRGEGDSDRRQGV
ncbi:Phosphoglucosamine mutase [Frankliniella fusca]|uniref:Phosphoglucosamine mutase n=1 Tax=Frankliniella fusca TaxID=407009 RepID=A0AAE1LUM6_9NEOP|nr:Phosphoglucosamine mutase [Frankliniella fusca]